MGRVSGTVDRGVCGCVSVTGGAAGETGPCRALIDDRLKELASKEARGKQMECLRIKRNQGERGTGVSSLAEQQLS